MTLEEAYQMGYRCASIIKPGIVRCKDCKYGKEPILPYRKNCVWCVRIQRHNSNDWFCADGEKE